MKKFILFLFTLSLLLSFIEQQTDLIYWNADRPIKFEDFKAVQKDTIQIGDTTGRFKGAQSQLKLSLTLHNPVTRHHRK